MMSHNKKQPNSTQKKKMKTFEMCNNYFQETLCVTQTRKQKEKPHSTKDDGTISLTNGSDDEEVVVALLSSIIPKLRILSTDSRARFLARYRNDAYTTYVVVVVIVPTITIVVNTDDFG